MQNINTEELEINKYVSNYKDFFYDNFNVSYNALNKVA